MFEITFQLENGDTVKTFAAPGQNLLSAARKAMVEIDAPCAGNGSCGKCRVRILEGEVIYQKNHHLSEEEESMGWRLACQCKVSSDITVWVPGTASAFKLGMKAADLSSEKEISIFRKVKSRLSEAGILFENGFSLYSITLSPPSLDDTLPDNERLVRALRAQTGETIHLTLTALTKLPDALRKEDFSVLLVVERCGGVMTVYDVFSKSEKVSVCGLAVDIGTTSVSGLLVDLLSKEILAKVTVGNSQIQYGADVINRIIESSRPGGKERLQSAIIDSTINPLIAAMRRLANIPEDGIYRMCIAGNTTMNHLFLGIPANPIRMEPYIPAFFETEPVLAGSLHLPIHPEAKLLIAPNVGSYVGGDITAGILSSTIWNKDEFSLFIDLGTNGELVFGNRDLLMTCACSAGPAFEGGDISCGMRATDGAIEAFHMDDDGSLHYTVIGDQKPLGLCGSGIIDVISELFSHHIINAKGNIIGEGDRITRDEHGIGSFVLAFAEETESGFPIALSEIDIQNFIHAKAAIYSAIRTLLNSLGFDLSMICDVYVAGGIGSGINMENAIHIGMFPDIERDRFHYIGNTSLAGAYTILVSDQANEKVSQIARNMTYLELSTDPSYMDEFIGASFLPHTDTSLFPSIS